MEEVYKELEDLRSEMETLKEEYRLKCQLSENLRRAHDEQVDRLQEAKAKIEKQEREIDSKAEEICSVKQICENLKSSFAEKETALKSLDLANENLRTSFRENMRNLEGENKELALALDEANAKREEQERMMCSYLEEIEGLKSLLSVSQRRCSDAEHRAQAPREVRRRDEMLLQLEEEKGEVENQLKWKIEQFRHLEEAHSKLQDEFWAAKREWGSERSNLLDEIHTLQMNLDSQTRVVEDLRSQLNMCNQALAHEESRRKLLEVQMSESKALHDNVVLEYEEARSTIEALTTRRDEEIASLRNALSIKATALKEMEYTRYQIEQENEELRESLKEHQEAQINGVGAAASLKTLRQKFKALEQAHRGCSEKLKARAIELKTQMEKLGMNLDECLSQLSSRDKQLQELQIELEGSHSLLMQQKLENEEMSVVLMVVKSKFLQSCSKIETLKHEAEHHGAKVEERIALMTKQLEKKDIALIQAQAKAMQEHEMVDSLQSRTEYLESIEQKHALVLKELDTYKGMLEESCRNFDRLNEQASQKENNLQEDLRKASNVLEQANYALAEKTSELNKVEFELEQWKLVVERMEMIKSDLEIQLNKYEDERQAATRELEVALLARMQAEKSLMEEKENFHQIAEERDKIVEELRQCIVCMEEDNARRASQKESKLQEDLRKASNALEQANYALAEKTSQLNKVEFELEQQKLVTKQMEKIKSDLEAQLNKYHDERQAATRESEVALLAKMQAEKSFMEEKEKFHQKTEERDNIIEELRQHIVCMEGDNARRASQKESNLQEDWRKASYALDLANYALADKTSELNKVEFELEQQKLVMEQMEKMKSDLETQLDRYHDERQAATRELEVACLAKIQAEKSLMEEKENFCHMTEERDKILEELRQHIICMEEDNARRESEVATLVKLEAEKITEKHKKKFLEFAEDVNRRLKGIETKFDLLEQNCVLRESETLMTLEQEKVKWFKVMKEKENIIAGVQKHVLSLEQNITQFVEAAAASNLADKQLEICKLYEALQKFAADYLLDELEIQFKNMWIAELETEISTLQWKLKVEEKLSLDSKKCVERLKAEIATVRLEKEKEQILVLKELKSMQSNKRTLEDQLGQCTANIKTLHDIVAHFTSEREKLVGQIMGFNEIICMIFHMDEDLSRTWDRVMQKAGNEDSMKTSDREDLFSSGKLDGRNCISPSRNKAGLATDRRSPWKEYNC
ncbi:uncharacterized protein At4g38062 [Elaeis guineensis]|uniref:uncharacterized protein At4g38062 n=1 Tax=Elaeis guineensis var. tenera TaxID=51953 RepID=UPI003C6CF766